ncbi:multi-sensor hybrid histidine kinase [Sulfurimonas gotlandica GD1]|uniref:Sensory/regulatory protein RpfC n=2 Tax=Sulfurimonas TaxID=202746 RepID=H1FWW9_SULGG|nr:multi-sensor hybrid histidine kinase [Sulfurimonas gotlandica GD1]
MTGHTLKNETDNLLIKLKKKENSTNDLKSHIAVYKNFIYSYPKATSLLKTSLKNKHHDTYEVINELFNKLMLHSFISVSNHNKDIENLIKKLEATKNLSDIDSKKLSHLIQHSKKIYYFMNEINKLEEKAHPIDFDKDLFILRDSYNIYFNGVSERAKLYQIILLIVGLLMFVWVMYSIIRIRLSEAEKENALNELHFQKFALDEHAIVSITDAKGKILYINDKFCEISQFQRGELIGKNHRVIKSNEHPDSLFKEMWETISSGSVWHGEIKNRKKDGSFYWVKSTIVPFVDDSGKPFQYISIRTDTTKQKELEERFQDQANFLNSITDNITEGLMVIDDTGNLIYSNKSASTLLEQRDDELLDSNFYSDVLVENENITLSKFDSLMKKSGVLHSDDVLFKTKNGKNIDIEMSAVSVLRHNKKSLIVVFKDISDRKILQDSLIEAKLIAEEASKTKSNFLANMSHELRTPLNGIIGMSYIALNQDTDPRIKNYLDKIHTSGNILLKIINDILDFSKIEAGKLDVESIEFNLDDMLKKLSDFIHLKAYEKDLELVIFKDQNTPTSVIGDPLRINQILLNLLSNSIKFTDHGEIEISVEALILDAADSKLVFTIRDTGVGMTKEELDRIFNSFSQADSTIARRYGGTGLGLTITKQLIELMDGNISVESEKGVGTTFKVELPLHTSKRDIVVKQYSEKLQNIHCYLFKLNSVFERQINKILTSMNIKSTSADSFDLIPKNIDEDNTSILITEYNDSVDVWIKGVSEKLPVLIYYTPHDDIHVSYLQHTGKVQPVSKPLNSSVFYDSIMMLLFETEKTQLQKEKVSYENISAKVLLAEDNEINQMVAIEFLESFNCDVDVVNNGKEAVEKLTTDKYDIVFMDIQMPEMDGLSATKMIREKLKLDIPIVAMTANAMKQDVEASLAVGMNAHISKPIDPNEIKKNLQKFVKKSIVVTSQHELNTLEEIDDSQDEDEQSVAMLLKISQSELGVSDTVMEKFVNKFMSTLDNSISELQKGINDSDYDKIQKAAHKLRGAALNLRITPLIEATQEMEHNAKEENTIDYAIHLDKIVNFKNSYKEYLKSKEEQ